MPLITLAVSMFGGVAMGAVQVRVAQALSDSASSSHASLPSALLRQGLEWFASLLREDDDGDVADEFLIEAACAAQEEPSAAEPLAECRGALRPLAVSRRPRPPAWQRVVGGWPMCADVAA